MFPDRTSQSVQRAVQCGKNGMNVKSDAGFRDGQGSRQHLH